MEEPNSIEPGYSVRVSLWSSDATYWQTDDALVWRTSQRKGRVRYDQIKYIQIYKIRYVGSRRSYWRFVLCDVKNNKIILQASYCLGFRQFEDRSAEYYPFVKRLETRIRAKNPAALFQSGGNWLSLWDSVIGKILISLLRMFGCLRIETASGVASKLMRCIGPRLKGHRTARANLSAAFPEKSTADIEQILTGMWDNMGRVVAEYAHLGSLWDLDHDAGQRARICIDDANKPRFAQMQTAPGPAMVFGAHTGNWEMLCWALGTRNAEAAVVYRRPPVRSVEGELARLRRGAHVSYIPANINAPFKIINAMRRGAWIGLLVDEASPNGIPVTFFGRKCTASPLFAKIARQFNCPIYGARIIRSPEGRLKLDLAGPIEPTRDGNGEIDISATTQQITSIIESWVREYPDQWLWFQRRWR